VNPVCEAQSFFYLHPLTLRPSDLIPLPPTRYLT
jgi:hypothetical protein